MILHHYIYVYTPSLGLSSHPARISPRNHAADHFYLSTRSLLIHHTRIFLHLLSISRLCHRKSGCLSGRSLSDMPLNERRRSNCNRCWSLYNAARSIGEEISRRKPGECVYKGAVTFALRIQTCGYNPDHTNHPYSTRSSWY